MKSQKNSKRIRKELSPSQKKQKSERKKETWQFAKRARETIDNLESTIQKKREESF